MKQVTQRLKNGRIEVLDVPSPAVAAEGVLVDVRASLLSPGTERSTVEAARASLIGKARAASVDVVWIQHNSDELPTGSESWQFVPELVRRDSEPLVQKAYGDAFEETDLGREVLADGGTVAPRDVLVHVIEEYARHAGHADLLRECIDGRTGQ